MIYCLFVALIGQLNYVPDELSDNIDNFHPGDAIIACIQNSSLWGNIYDESRALDVIDWLLGHGFGHAQPLEHILKSAGHVLRVSPDGNCR